MKKKSTVQTFSATDKHKKCEIAVSNSKNAFICFWFYSCDSLLHSSASVVTISCLLYFFTEWQFFSGSVCSQWVSGFYTTADFQLELGWQVSWWCTCYKTTWIIPGDVFAGLRAVNHPGVSCNPDYTDRTSWRGVIFSTALYGLSSASKSVSKRETGMILRVKLAI